MAEQGDEYYIQMTVPQDCYPTRRLKLGEYLPNVLAYAQGGIDVYVERQDAEALLTIVGQEQRTAQSSPGENAV